MGLLDGLLGTGEPGIKVGDAAPEFDLTDAAGKRVRLSDFRGKRNVVLYFYPKDDTPGCTKEACSFRDSYQSFTDAGAEVIGVSSDDGASHQKFAEKFHLPFTLVSDTGGAVRKRYGVPATLGLTPRPSDFRNRPRRHRPPRLQLPASSTKHVDEALSVIKKAPVGRARRSGRARGRRTARSGPRGWSALSTRDR
jgi:peroxiredoxin Q/BCP